MLRMIEPGKGGRTSDPPTRHTFLHSASHRRWRTSSRFTTSSRPSSIGSTVKYSCYCLATLMKEWVLTVNPGHIIRDNTELARWMKMDGFSSCVMLTRAFEPSAITANLHTRSTKNKTWSPHQRHAFRRQSGSGKPIYKYKDKTWQTWWTRVSSSLQRSS